MCFGSVGVYVRIRSMYLVFVGVWCFNMLRSSVRFVFFFQAEDGIRDLVRSRGLGDVYKRQEHQRILL